ncbi:MAG: C4-type zinc ribbon domain-containing protein [bacterium]
MQKQLENLARLQEIDDRLSMLERSKGDYPERIEQLEEELEERRGDVEESRKRREELEKEQRHLERVIQEQKTQMEKYQKQLADVKTNKEWDALQKEMDAVKKKMAASEDQLLEVLEELGELEESVGNAAEELGDFKSQAETEIKDLKQKLGSVDTRMSRMRSERDALSTQIDDRLKRVYNRVKQGKQGTAVVPVVRGACGGCYSKIPPQTLNEIRKAERPITCENCGRIIIWPAEESDAS